MLLILMNFTAIFDLFDYHYVKPDYESYAIENISFSDYIPSAITSYDDIANQVDDHLMKANIYITNVFYNDGDYITRNFKSEGVSGSGVIFHESDDYYYALTNYHVIDQDANYEHQVLNVIDYYDHTYNAFIYENTTDVNLDIAVIVFEKEANDLTVLDLVDGHISINTPVIAIGNPLGVRNIITYGDVVDYHQVTTIDRYDNYVTHSFRAIIHNAHTDHGSSGSMLINYDFKIVGINFASNEDEYNPLSDATPSDLIVAFLESVL